MTLEVPAIREWRLLNSRDQLTWCLFSADAILYSWLCSIIFLFWSFSKGCTKLEHINISWCTQISSHGLKLLSQGCKNLLIFIAEGCCLVRKQTWFVINILHTSLLCVSLFKVFVTYGKYPLCVYYIVLFYKISLLFPSLPPPPTERIGNSWGMRRAQISINAKVNYNFHGMWAGVLGMNPFHGRGYPLIHSYARKTKNYLMSL